MLLWSVEELLESPSLLIGVLRENIKKRKDIVKTKISYGKLENQYILIFSPEPENRRNGVVFFIHGGWWQMFNPMDMQFIGHFFAHHGYPAVMPGYRLAPRYHFPAQMDDVFNAFRKYLEVSKQFGLNSGKTIAAGQSAGGELAGLLVFNRNEQKKYRIDPKLFRGMISISGPLDLTRHSKSAGNEKMYRAFAPTEEDRKNASPIQYITGREKIPVLCIHGDRDPVIEISHSESFVGKINEKKKGLAELRVIKNRHHSDLAQLFLSDMDETKALIRWMDDKIR